MLTTLLKTEKTVFTNKELQQIFPDIKWTSLAVTLSRYKQTGKILNLSIDPEYESYQEKGHYKQRFIGYRFSHVLKIEFPSDNDRLGSVLYALARSPLDPEFRISYTVADPEAAKNELLGRAVKDAAQKAEVLSRAAGVSLKEILSVDYSWGQINFDVTPMNRMMADESVMLAKAAPAGGYALDIEPDDIEVSDTVTVVWAIG